MVDFGVWGLYSSIVYYSVYYSSILYSICYSTLKLILIVSGFPCSLIRALAHFTACPELAGNSFLTLRVCVLFIPHLHEPKFAIHLNRELRTSVNS